MNKMFTYKFFNEFSKELEQIWVRLENNGDFYFFQRYQYAKNLVSNFNVKSLIIVVVYKKNIPIAIFPLELKNYKKIKVLQWLGTNHSDYCGPLISKDNVIPEEHFKLTWKNITQAIKGFDIIILNKQPEYINSIINPFVQFLSNDYHSKVHQIHIMNDNEDYLFDLQNKKFSSELKRTKKKLFKEHKVKFCNNLLLDQNNLIEKIITKKISLLKKNKLSHSINENFIIFFNNLSKFYPKKVFANTLEINNEIIAANIGIIDNQRYYYLLPVILSEKFNSYSPGKILINEIINWSKKKELKIFDFGIGEEVYKKYWSNSTMKIFRCIDFKGIRGLFLYFCLKIYFRFRF